MLRNVLNFLPLLLKTAGYRCGGKTRCSSRNKRWSKSAQTIFASWAVVGQLGGMSLLVAEVIEPQLAKSAEPPIEGDSTGSATSSGTGAFAIGTSATTGAAIYAQASGYAANAAGDYSQTSGYRANAFGRLSTASGTYATAAGNFSQASGAFSRASSNYSQASGFGATASGTDSGKSSSA